MVDAQGVAVTDLRRDDFRIYDNDVQRSVENLWLDADLPLTLGVIIDVSESQRDHLAEHRRTALGLVERILRPGDRAFVISVAEDVKLWADLTAGPAEVGSQMAVNANKLFGLQCPKRRDTIPGGRPISECGDSPLWNAVYETARLKMRTLDGAKALLLLTDGFDTGSMRSWRQAADEALGGGATVYAIQYQSGLGGKFAPDLYRLVDETGGAIFNPPREDFNPIVSRIETDLRMRYVLGFRPDKLSANVRHDVRVEVDRPGLSVRARKTYFRPPE